MSGFSISAPGVGVAGFFCVAVIMYSITRLAEDSPWRIVFAVAAVIVGIVTVLLEREHIKLRREGK
jgi:MFS family permease